MASEHMELSGLSSQSGGKRKIFRDNVHGYISMPSSLVSFLVDTPEFQRLRSIEQTSMRPLFPAAHHDRFIHSLGAYDLGLKAFDCMVRNANANDDLGHLGDGKASFNLDKYLERRRLLFSIACLLHDCGHAPFSHTFENYYVLARGDGSVRLDDELVREYAGDPDFVGDYHRLCQRGGAAAHERMSALMVRRHFCDGIGRAFESEGLKAPDDRELALAARMIMGCVYRGNISEIQSFDNCLISLLNSSTVDVDGLDYSMRDTIDSGVANTSVDYDRLLGSLSAPVTCYFDAFSSEDSAEKGHEGYAELRGASFRGVFLAGTEFRASLGDAWIDPGSVGCLSGDFTLTFNSLDAAQHFRQGRGGRDDSTSQNGQSGKDYAIKGARSFSLPWDAGIVTIRLDGPCDVTLNNWTGRARGEVLRTPEYVRKRVGEISGNLSRRHVLAFGKGAMISLEGALSARNLLYRQIYAHPQVLYRSSFLLHQMLRLSAKYLRDKRGVGSAGEAEGRVGSEENLEGIIERILGLDGFYADGSVCVKPSSDEGVLGQLHFDASDDNDLLALFKWVYLDNRSRPKADRDKDIERYFGEYFGRKGKRALWKSYEEYQHFLSSHREDGLEGISFEDLPKSGTTPSSMDYVFIDDEKDYSDQPIGAYMRVGYKGLLAIKATQKVKAIDYDSTFVRFPDGIERYSDVAGYLPESGKNEFVYLFCDSDSIAPMA